MTRLSWSLFALPLAVAAGCADNSITLQVLANQPPTVPACMVTTAVTGTSQSSGILDVGVVEAGAGAYAGYTVYPVVKNNLMDPSPGALPQRDDIQIIGTDVQLVVTGALDAALPSNQRSFFQPAYGGDVPSGQTGSLTVEVVPLQVAVELDAALQDNQTIPMIVRFRVVGTKADGGTITSGWTDYPVKVCRWCLTGGKPPVCPKGGVAKTSVFAGACNVAQDMPVTCCIGSTNRLLCGGAVPQTTM
jgi:hypothetical protein